MLYLKGIKHESLSWPISIILRSGHKFVCTGVYQMYIFYNIVCVCVCVCVCASVRACASMYVSNQVSKSTSL